MIQPHSPSICSPLQGQDADATQSKRKPFDWIHPTATDVNMPQPLATQL